MRDPKNKDESRMAGKAIEEMSAKDEGFRNALERSIGTEEYDRIGKEGQDDPDSQGRYSAREVISEFRNRPKGTSVDEGDDSMVAKYQKMVNDGTTFNPRAQKYLERHGVDFGGDIISDPITDPEPSPVEDEAPQPVSVTVSPTYDNEVTFAPPGTAPGVDGYGGQSLQAFQNNPLTQTVTGDNNVTTAYQDNSIGQYGGSNYLNDWMRRHNFFA